VRFERNMVPLLPFLALGAGWMLDAGADWLVRRSGRGSGLSHTLAASGAALLLILPLIAGVSFDASLSRTDLREVAARWVEDNIAAGSKIAIEHYAVPFEHADYDVQDVIRISNHGLDWYRSEGFDILIISDGVWDLLRRQPEVYREKVQAYNQLVTRSELLAEFASEPGRIVTAGYPTVAIYHYAPVRIYRVPD
jgi:hypothetical protein